MPGPMSSPKGGTPLLDDNGDVIGHSAPPRDPHDRCQERDRCTGPGCRIRTGKTTRNRTNRTK